jgi:ABC-type multidrug transport system fused ATPase/permease subunit
MPEKGVETSNNWVERICNAIHIPYPLLSLIIGCLVYIIFYFFNTNIDFLAPQWDVQHRINILVKCLTISIQFSGIMYLTNKMKMIFSNLDALESGADNNCLSELKKRIAGSLWYYVVLVIVIVPFYIIDLFRGLDGGIAQYYYQHYLPCYFLKDSLFNLTFDVFNFIIAFMILFMLSTALWIMIALARILNEFSENASFRDLRKYITEIEMTLKAIRRSLVNALAYYFVLISISIPSSTDFISSVASIAFSESPMDLSIKKTFETQAYTFENVFMIILLLVGIAFFVIGINSLKDIFNSQYQMAMSIINIKSHDYLQKLEELQPYGSPDNDLERLNYISSMLDELQKQRERLMQTISPGYSLSTIGTFVTAFLIPLLTIIDKVKPGMIADLISYVYSEISWIV